MTLFPEYPPLVPTARVATSCCEGLRPPPGVSMSVWTAVHAMAHSRVPFTVDGFRAVVDATEHETRVAIRQAGQRDWLHPVWPERYQTNPIEQWVGTLPRRR